MAMHTGEPMPYRTADTRDLVAVQRAMERMAGYLAAVTPSVAAGDVVAAGTVADLATELADAVRRLDAAEAELLWPVLRAYLLAMEATDEANELIRIDGQGERLVHLIEQTAMVVARFRGDAPPRTTGRPSPTSSSNSARDGPPLRRCAARRAPARRALHDLRPVAGDRQVLPARRVRSAPRVPDGRDAARVQPA